MAFTFRHGRAGLLYGDHASQWRNLIFDPNRAKNAWPHLKLLFLLFVGLGYKSLSKPMSTLPSIRPSLPLHLRIKINYTVFPNSNCDWSGNITEVPKSKTTVFSAILLSGMEKRNYFITRIPSIWGRIMCIGLLFQGFWILWRLP